MIFDHQARKELAKELWRLLSPIAGEGGVRIRFMSNRVAILLRTAEDLDTEGIDVVTVTDWNVIFEERRDLPPTVDAFPGDVVE